MSLVRDAIMFKHMNEHGDEERTCFKDEIKIFLRLHFFFFGGGVFGL